MRRFWIKLIVNLAIPPGVWWIRRHEAVILREGRVLSEEEFGWARQVGVDEPETVRVLPVPRVPTPGAPILKLMAGLSRVPVDSPTGMAVNRGIFLEASHATNPSLLVHELVHVAQFEKMGGIAAFLREYLTQCLRDGYWDSAMEEEARAAAAPFPRPPDR